MPKKIFVNLPVKDLNKTKEFFKKLGFQFNPQFTDEKSACLIIDGNIFIMLLKEKFFKDFIPGKEITNTDNTTEVLTALSTESREEVDEIINNAIEAGGKEYREVSDHGWMYARAFQDLDGHIWEILHMDENQMPEEMRNKKNEN